MLRIELSGRRKSGRINRRFTDAVREDMTEIEVTEEDAEDRNSWRWKIRCGDPKREKPKEEEEETWLHSHELINPGVPGINQLSTVILHTYCIFIVSYPIFG